MQPFGETAVQVFARVSALREALTGTGVRSLAVSLLVLRQKLDTICACLCS